MAGPERGATSAPMWKAGTLSSPSAICLDDSDADSGTAQANTMESASAPPPVPAAAAEIESSGAPGVADPAPCDDAHATADQSTEEESLSGDSEASDLSDMFHVQPLAQADMHWTTTEDLELARIDALSEHIRDRPLLPPHPSVEGACFVHVNSGVALPRVHCAFETAAGHTWVGRAPMGHPATLMQS